MSILLRPAGQRRLRGQLSSNVRPRDLPTSCTAALRMRSSMQKPVPRFGKAGRPSLATLAPASLLRSHQAPSNPTAAEPDRTQQTQPPVAVGSYDSEEQLGRCHSLCRASSPLHKARPSPSGCALASAGARRTLQEQHTSSGLPHARPNLSLKLTRYGSRRLAAPGAGGIMPSAAKRRLPPRAA